MLLVTKHKTYYVDAKLRITGAITIEPCYSNMTIDTGRLVNSVKYIDQRTAVIDILYTPIGEDELITINGSRAYFYGTPTK